MSAPIRFTILVCSLWAWATAEAAWPPSQCTHVEVLDSGDTDQVSWRFDGTVTAIDGTLEDARPNQLDTLGEALDMLPEFLCKSVRKVAFVNRPPDQSLLDMFGGDEETAIVSGWTTVNDRQNVVYLNTNSLSPWHESSLGFSEIARHEAIQRAVHESTHVAVRLLLSQQKAELQGFMVERPDADDLWPASVQQVARDIIAANRLQTGVMREWKRIHAAFVGAGMAEAYYGSDWPEKDGFGSGALAKAGFMSAYGGDKAGEDIAEMTSWAIVRNSHPESRDAACSVMNGRSGAGVKSEDAAVFTKLGFVRTLGFISEQHYKACVGSLKIDASGPGFFSYKNGNLTRSYTGNPSAGAGRGSGDDEQWLIANITAEGSVTTSSEEVPVTVTLMLNVTPPVDAITGPGKRADRLAILPAEVSYPRGVYFVGARHGKLNRLQMARRSDNALIMDVGQGVALISRASSDGIVGSVAIQRVFNYSGGLLSAIAGDEPVKDPSKITFRYMPRSN